YSLFDALEFHRWARALLTLGCGLDHGLHCLCCFVDAQYFSFVEIMDAFANIFKRTSVRIADCGH
ncbi:MAG: hypothetical protein WB630_18430, partial [Candidatus Acidiferrales bacterium]